MARILILGGTIEARAIANALAEREADAVTALAGRTPRPSYPGQVRVGGFGGVAGLADYLMRERVEVLLDCTHPFAATISPNAQQAATETGTRYLRLERPPWAPQAGDNWHDVASLVEAADALPFTARAFLGVGAQSLPPFLRRTDTALIVRSIVRPAPGTHPNVRIVEARGPFTEAGDAALFTAHAISVVVAKNAGGDAASAKLAAARRLGLPVIMVARPEGQPPADAATPHEAMALLAVHL